MTEEEFLALLDATETPAEPVQSTSFIDDVLQNAFNPTERQIERNRGIVRSLAQGIPFVGGFADEAEARLRALPAYLTDEDYADRYERELGTVRGYLEAAREDSPVAAFGAELASGLSPIGIGKTVLSRLGLSGLEGFLQGWGRGEGDERLEQGVTSGLTSTGLSALLQSLGAGGRALNELVQSRVEPSELRSIGINMPNLSKSARKAKDFIKSGFEDEIPLQRAARKGIKQGIVKPGQSAFERIAVINDKKDEVFGIIEDVTRRADAVTGKLPVRIDPEIDFRESYKLLNELNPDTTEYQRLKNIIDEQALAIGSQLERKGTLEEMLRQKRMLYAKAYDFEGTARGKDLEKALGKDLKRMSEERISALADIGAISPESRKMFDAANKSYGELETLQRAYVDNVAKDLPDDIRKEFIDTIRTSGGFGTILNYSALQGGKEDRIEGIIGLLGAMSGSEQGQAAIARGLKMASPATTTLERGLSAAERVLRPGTVGARIREIAYQGDEGEGMADGTLTEAEFLDLLSAIDDGTDTNPTEKKSPEVEMPVTQDLISAVISVESAGKPKAVSPKGAQGLMQVMPATAREVLEELGRDPESYDPFDPEQNVLVGTHYLNKMLDMFGGDVELALAAYNGGPGRVRRLLNETGGQSFRDIVDRLPRETREYVPKVLNRIERA